jgi:Na+/H+-dicarboxylate symporter
MFIFTSSIAVICSIFITNMLKPGANFALYEVMSKLNINTVPQASDAPNILPIINNIKQDFLHNFLNILDILPNFIPNNIFQALAQGLILQVIALAFFIGIMLNKNREKCSHIVVLFEESANLFFKIIETFMYVAPVGVFGYIAALVGGGGWDVLLTMSKLVATILLACMVQYILYGVIIFIFTQLSPIYFYKKILNPQLMAISTSSSKATLPTLIEVAENHLGISKSNTRFLLPLSAALNMDGGAIYQSVCAIFFAQVFQHNLQLVDYVILLFTCTLASIGGAGIPGGVLIFLGMVLHSIGLPLDGILLVASVDRILDMFTTAVNITGGACNTLIIDNKCKTLDLKRYKS